MSVAAVRICGAAAGAVAVGIGIGMRSAMSDI